MTENKGEYGMPDKTIIMLSPQNITKLGHNVMIPHGIRCEWTISGKQCPVLLGCYEFVKQVCFVFDYYLHYSKAQTQYWALISVTSFVTFQMAPFSLYCLYFYSTKHFIV